MSLRPSFRPRLPMAAAMVVLGLLTAACGDDPPTDFTADTRTGFMAACSVPLDDSRLVSDICQCVFEQTQNEIPFTRFSATDRQLKEDPERVLSAEINGIIADCIIEEAEL
ncbi:MAG: hypothetical protein ACR2QK_19730 [Acidimicrobiales bacterium]